MDSSVQADVDVSAQLGARIARAVGERHGIELPDGDALIRPSPADRPADFQSSVALRLGKQLTLDPLEVAEGLAAELGTDGVIGAVEVSPPGFLNFEIAREWLQDGAAAMAADGRLGVGRRATARRVVIDYSAPNVAKEMHVGHLRSTIIGDALARIAAFLGDTPIAQNHIGDWGTPFGMLLEHLRELGWDSSGAGEIDDLDEFYRDARVRFDGEPGFADRARRRVVELQGEEPDTLALWQQLVEESQRHYNHVYALLGVGLTDDDLAGESLYRHRLPGVIEDLLEAGVAVVADGAVCVFPAGFVNRDGDPLPLILRKRDGGYTYGATDLAAIRHRVGDLEADELLYVVGAPQRLHLEMVLAVARLAGWLPESVRARHVAFGSVLGEDGKMLRTRAGATVKLVELLDEAIERARLAIVERNSERTDGDDLARAIGIGAIKYADLSTSREKDYAFSFTRMLALEGNTSVYLHYANARALSVLRRAQRDPPPPRFVVDEPAERALVLRLLAFPQVLARTAETAEPHRLCAHLYATAVAFSTFYTDCPILSAPDPDVRASRLGLTELTHRVLTRGLDLLGIAAPDQL